MGIFFHSLYFLHCSMQLCEPYISDSPNLGDTGLASNNCYCLDFFSSYNDEIAYQTSENK